MSQLDRSKYPHPANRRQVVDSNVDITDNYNENLQKGGSCQVRYYVISPMISNKLTSLKFNRKSLAKWRRNTQPENNAKFVPFLKEISSPKVFL